MLYTMVGYRQLHMNNEYNYVYILESIYMLRLVPIIRDNVHNILPILMPGVWQNGLST